METNFVSKTNYLHRKGYWSDPFGNIRQMSGEQEIIATVMEAL